MDSLKSMLLIDVSIDSNTHKQIDMLFFKIINYIFIWEFCVFAVCICRFVLSLHTIKAISNPLHFISNFYQLDNSTYYFQKLHRKWIFKQANTIKVSGTCMHCKQKICKISKSTEQKR